MEFLIAAGISPRITVLWPHRLQTSAPASASLVCSTQISRRASVISTRRTVRRTPPAATGEVLLDGSLPLPRIATPRENQPAAFQQTD